MFPFAMSSEEIIGSSSIVPRYNKDKKAIEIHLSIQTNNTKKFTYANLNPFEIVFQNQNCTVNNNFNCQENRNPQKDPIIEINVHHEEMELGPNLHRREPNLTETKKQKKIHFYD